MGVVLWHIELSHYNEKARWALDYKGVPHRRRAPLPGLHGAYAAVLTRSSHRRLPVLVLDGKGIGDSTAIIAALEERYPEPPLYPSDAQDRVRALAFEEFFDDELAPHVRRFNFHHTLPDTDAVVDSILPRASSARRRVLRTALPLLSPLMRREYGIDPARAEHARAKIAAAMDRLEAELQPSGYLVGDAFTVADLTAAALFTPLLLPPQRQYPPTTAAPAVRELRAELEARPGGAWVAEMFARHRGVSAEVA